MTIKALATCDRCFRSAEMPKGSEILPREWATISFGRVDGPWLTPVPRVQDWCPSCAWLLHNLFIGTAYTVVRAEQGVASKDETRTRTGYANR